MSFYDDASLVFLASGAAGKDGTAFNLKPVEELTGPNKVINGGFDSDSDWSKGTGWSISGGLASCDGTQTGNTGLSQLLSSDRLEEGETYKVTYTISNYVAGQVNPHIRGTATGNVTGNGTKVVYGVAGNSASYDINFFADSNFNASIDNVSIRKVVNKAADFTFTRGTNLTATRVGKDGYIEKGRENLLLQSNQFDTTWYSLSITSTSGQNGYDGSTNAWKVEKIAASFRFLRQLHALSGIHTLSVYAKAGTLDVVSLFFRNGSGNDTAMRFNLTTGQTDGTRGTTNFISADIVDAGNGWWRCSMTYNHVSGDEIRIYPDFEEADAGYIYIQDAQLEAGLVATDYIETGATTATAGLLEDEPRFDYTGGGCPALLMEPARTNLVSNSEGIIGGSNAVTTTLNYGVAPDGATSSLKVQKNGTSANERIIVSDDLAVLDASTYTVSGFVKNIDIADTGVTTIGARVNAGTLFRQGYEWTGSSLASTSYASSGSTSNTVLEDYGNGWWRIGFTFTTDGTQLDFEIDIDRQNAVHTTSIETWGWQLEAGSNATSYIPTYGSSATRDQDVSSASGLSGVINSSEGVLYAELKWTEISNSIYLSLSDGSNSNGVLIYRTAENNVRMLVRVGGVTQALFIVTEDSNEYVKVAAKYKTDDFAIWVNGTERATDTSGSTFSPNTLNKIGFDAGSSGGFSGLVKQIIYFPTALSNNDTEILTGAPSYRSFNVLRSVLNYTAYE